MARSLRDLRRKMKAIRSTRQVTKAMELVAASKMRRATQSAVQLRRYALTAWQILETLAEANPGLHPFLTERPPQRILGILFSPDRGLCGSLSAQMFRMVMQYIAKLQAISAPPELSFVAVGKKGQQFLLRNRQTIIAAFPAFSAHPQFRDILPIVRLATDSFLGGQCDSVVLLYPDFISALLQEPTSKVLLPFSKTSLKEMLDDLLPHKKGSLESGSKNQELRVSEYLFEPSADDILRQILPQLTEVQIYQALLEAVASEHSARMVAMRNATENASDLLDDLTLTYNITRQAGITAELAELSASKAALGGD